MVEMVLADAEKSKRGSRRKESRHHRQKWVLGLAFGVLLCLSGCENAYGNTENAPETVTAGAKSEANSNEIADAVAVDETDAVEMDSEDVANTALGAEDPSADGNTNLSGAGEDEGEVNAAVLPEGWGTRNTGSAAYINGKTVLVDIFLDEPELSWTKEEMEIVLARQRIAYSYLEEQVAEYGETCELIYDWEQEPELCFQLTADRKISKYVEVEEERELDAYGDELIAKIPTEEILQTYQADGIAYLFWIPHEGCSYTSMHFEADKDYLWYEREWMYLRDLYSPTLEYETPAVYAHELLHLFGAEDLYSSAGVFEKSTYRYVAEHYSNDLMGDNFEMINGVYTTYPDRIKQTITPITAMFLGLDEEPDLLEACPELKRNEVCVFPGSTFDRPF